jgi:hypothetical protein
MAQQVNQPFATSGFSFDPNISPNSNAFTQAVLAVVFRAAQPLETAIQPFLPGGGTSVATASTAGTLAAGGFANPSNKVSGTATNGTSTLAMRADSAPALDWAQSPTWSGNHIFNPATGTPLSVQIAGVNRFQVNGTTTSIQGQGPLAGALIDMTPDATTFIGTLSGVTPSVTGTLTARRMGNFATLSGSFVGTSNANTLTVTGIPAAWQPALDQFLTCNLENNGSNIEGVARISPGSGTIVCSAGAVSGTFVTHNSAGFTASGQKGLNLTVIGPYQLA